MHHPLNILIVDDQPEKVRYIKTALLAGYDCTIDIALTYQGGVDKLRDNNYDIALIDYRLTDSCGSLPSGCKPGTGKMLMDAFNRKCRFILYTADPSGIEDAETKILCIDFKDLSEHLRREIYYCQQPKNEEDKPTVVTEKESEAMQNNKKLPPWWVLIPVLVLVAGLIGTYSVAQYKTDQNDLKITTHCSQDEIYKEKQIQKEMVLAAKLAEIQTTQKNMETLLNDIKSEMRRARR